MKLVSFDVWDTILRRKCAPDENKLAAAKYIYLMHYNILKDEYKNIFSIDNARKQKELFIAEESCKKGYDSEYCMHDVFSLLCREIFNENIDIDIEKLVQKLIDVEVNHEINITYLDSEIINIAEKYKNEDKIYISDFYMKKEDLDKILARFNDKLGLVNGYVSCDYQINKKSGRLFSKAEKDFNISPENHIHYGDNPDADLYPAKNLGINAVLFQPESETKLKLEKEKRFQDRKNGIVSYFNLNNPNVNSSNSLVNIGSEYALIFFCFVMEIIEYAVKNKFNKIYYCTREGEFYSKIHKIIKENGEFSSIIPDYEIIEVSRMATFAPSLYEFSLKELKRIWTQYHSQSFSDLYKALNIDTAPYIKYFEKYSIKVNEKITSIYNDEKVINLLNDDEYAAKMREETALKRSNLKEYMKTKGINEKTEKILLVDIGWRGSIQDNIALIYPEIQVDGYYFGLFKSFYDNVKNTAKYSFMNYDDTPEYMWVLKFVDPVEMICNSASGSTTGYEKIDNQYMAVKVNYKEEDIVYENFIKYFQEGVLSTIKHLVTVSDTYSLVSSEYKENALKLLEKLAGNPEKILASAYFSLTHNEMFGKGCIEKKEGNLNWKLKLLSIFSKKYREKLFSKIENSHWPQGMLVNNSLGRFCDEYNKKIKKETALNAARESKAFNKQIDFAYLEDNTLSPMHYIDKLIINEDYIEIEGWLLLHNIPSENVKICIKIESDNNVYYDTKEIIRTDVTKHINDGTDYNKSGFVCRIPAIICGQQNNFHIYLISLYNEKYYQIKIH